MISNSTKRFIGAYTTIITPFDEKNNIDEVSLRKLVEFQISSGVKRICPNGVTGEAAALTDEEKIRVTEIVFDQSRGRAMVIPDIGTECLQRTIDLAQRVEKIGVEAVLAFTPYLDPPTTRGMKEYFLALADSISIPLMIHNLPGRTTIDISPQTVNELAEHPRIIGIKEGNQDMVRMGNLISLVKNKDFVVLSGNDFMALLTLLLGGHGHISVAANVIPRQSIAIVDAALNNDFVTARDLYTKYHDFFKGIYLSTNPIALKSAFSLIHFDVGNPRLPLTPLEESKEDELRHLLTQCELI
ncbi:putative dihydrodipicolinate synthase [Photobacterium gaetbulicola Gung47]|uniref:4-hydroxy-tetrahydrodipicolinate synthase n=1 Tax=Photobacterium gaetbulicola Gung47 TaxID=658445 RepID=A0A0C5WGI4_9GAMM|nr:4-hydroxy-tetrahydrodipicolinate synthase [Photobacterium gaetbulicola]AJR05307.1 putative dihydrodipicolinate synthase [Photobacterium gaetbulicola Gung47]